MGQYSFFKKRNGISKKRRNSVSFFLEGLKKHKYLFSDGFCFDYLINDEKKEDSSFDCITDDGHFFESSEVFCGGGTDLICIPQCKFMNSTVLDEYAKHTVFVGRNQNYNGGDSIVGLGPSHIGGKSDSDRRWLSSLPFDVDGTHVSFDLWCLVGIVYGKALKIWRNLKPHKKVVPEFVGMSFKDMFESLNPSCSWKSLSPKTKEYWTEKFVEGYGVLRRTSLLYDLPIKIDGKEVREAYIMNSIMDSRLVFKRLKTDDGEEKRPFGIIARLRGHPLFDFCWSQEVPSFVQLCAKDFDCKRIFGTSRCMRKCFPVLWGTWLVQYRNYWKCRDKAFKTCDLIWKRGEMDSAFSNSVFNVGHLTTEEMRKVLEWRSEEKFGGVESTEKRRLFLSRCSILRRGEVSWELPSPKYSESVVLKDDDKKNTRLSEAGEVVPDEFVEDARRKMEEINLENSRHKICLGKTRIEPHESVIFNAVKKEDGSRVVDSSHNGRCYSMANGIQGLNRKSRMQVRIDGVETAEVDYNSLHPNMLYALNGIDCGELGMYDLGNRWHGGELDEFNSRKAVKMMLLRLINAKTKANAVHSFKTAWNESHGRDKKEYIPWLFRLYDEILKYHRAINHEFCSGKGTYLMNLDGRLIREVCHRLAKEHVCALGVHDSVVVRKDCAWRARKIMIEEYGKMFNGRKIGVSFKTFKK